MKDDKATQRYKKKSFFSRLSDRLLGRYKDSPAPKKKQKLVRIKTLQCPRCRRFVVNDDRGKKAHRTSCVAIPTVIPDGWGVKAEKK